MFGEFRMRPVRLLYFSRNKLDASQGRLAECVSEVVAKSVANNCKVDISGGLIFSTEWCAQALEGDRVAVAETFARIERDGRHGEITVIESRTMESRRFGFWWMAAAGWSTGAATIFKQYCGTERFDPRRLDGERMCDLIAAVIEHQMNNPISEGAPRWLSAWRTREKVATPATRSKILSAA
jgi:hypothetical protein